MDLEVSSEHTFGDCFQFRGGEAREECEDTVALPPPPRKGIGNNVRSHVLDIQGPPTAECPLG